MRRFGLRRRFLIFILTVFLVLFGVIAAMLIVRTASSERSSLNEQAKSFAALATKPIGDAWLLYKDSGSVRIKQQVDKFTELDPDITDISIADTQGKILFSSHKAPAINAGQAGTFQPVYVVKRGAIQTAIVPLIEDFGTHRYSLVYSVSDQRIIEDIQHTVATVVLLSIIVFTLALLLTYRLIDAFFISPVSNISSRAIKISQGNFEGQIQSNRNDEIGDLAVAVNTMANSLRADIAKLQEADRLKSEFIIIASHNLRTPLTSIKGNLDLLQEQNLDEYQRKMVDSGVASTALLDNFIEDLLAISSMESSHSGEHNMSAEPLKELLESFHGVFFEIARQKSLDFKFDLQLDEQKIPMNRPRLKIALFNLLENAFKFTKQGSVALEAKVDGDEVIIKIADTGIGITADELPKLFTKFHRGTSLMRYDYDGTGIGLYLSKLIITEHKGVIDVGSIEGQGTTFTVKLPLLLQ
jgi:signal transduction histidine kinase